MTLKVDYRDVARHFPDCQPREPDPPAAISIPVGTLPTGYIRGPRYRVQFDRIVTPRFTQDVNELRTFSMDIRQTLADAAAQELMEEADRQTMAALTTLGHIATPDVDRDAGEL
jgi:hypothetical protein